LYNTKNNDFLGYKKILEQVKVPYEIITNNKKTFDLVIVPQNICGLESFFFGKKNYYRTERIRNYWRKDW